MNVIIKEFFKKHKKLLILIGSIILSFAIGFCSGNRYRLGRIEHDSDGIEQSIDNIGSSATSAGANIQIGIGNLNNGLSNTDTAIGAIDRTTILNIELQRKIDELTGVTKAYKESLQLANSTINDLFDLGIRRAELDEEYINTIIRMLGDSSEGTSK